MKIKMFENIGKIIIEVLTNKTKEEKYFSEKYDNFFLVEDYLFCYKMIDEGYKASMRQKKKLDTVILSKLNNQTYTYRDIRLIKSLGEEIKITGLLKSISIPEKSNREKLEDLLMNENKNIYYAEFVLEELKDKKKSILRYTNKELKKYKAFYKSGLDSHNDFCNKNLDAIDEKLKIEKLMNVYIVLIKAGLFLPEEIKQIKEDFNAVSDYIRSKTSSSYQHGSFERIGKSTIDEFVKALIKYSHKNDNNELAKSLLNYSDKGDNNEVVKDMILKQLKSYNTREKSLDEEIKELMIKEEVFIKNLPKQEKEQVERIKALVNSVNNKEINDFVQERLPIILKKYFSIDEEYRTSLKNVEGYNAQQLMSLSLENIERIIIAKKENNNYDLITELSIENRKLKV